jgi:hypothetical protein
MPSKDPTVILFDLSCVGCAYNLRSLPSEGCCPECGQPIEETLTSFRSAWSPTHIQRWRRGCLLVGISGLLTAAVPGTGVAMVLLDYCLGISFNFNIDEAFLVAGVVPVVMLAEHALWLVGLWWLAGKHPGAQLLGSVWMNVQRSAAMVTAAVALVVSLILFEAALDNGGLLNSDAGSIALMLLILVGLITRMAGVVALMRLMSRTLGSLGAIWKRRHVMVTGSFVLLLCGVQLLSTLFLLAEISDARGGDWLECSAVIGIPSLMALPVIAVLSAVSIFRAGVAVKVRIED